MTPERGKELKKFGKAQIEQRSQAQNEELLPGVTDMEAALRHANAMTSAMHGFVSGNLSRPEFLATFKDALQNYRKVVESRPYYPLIDIADFTPRLDDQLKQLCNDALARLPRELLDRSTTQWILANLVFDDSFKFVNADGVSKFGCVLQLHKTPIERQSFLLSALNDKLKPMSFKYQHLLQTLRECSGDQLATWALCSEPDGAFAHIESVWSLGHTFEEPEQLANLERIRGDSVQWGNCYLLFLPADRTWLLVNYYDFGKFSIELHANATLCDHVAKALDLSS